MLMLIADAFDAALPEKLAQFGEVTDDKSRLPEADVVLVRSATKCTKEYIDSAPKLKLIIRGGVGIDNIDAAHARSKGIVVKNTPKASALAVGELAFAMMMAIPNRLIEAHNGIVAGKFLKKELKRTELFGKTLCMLGLGNIGTVVAERGKAFGMTVVGNQYPPDPHPVAEVKPSVAEAVSGADYVVMCLPKTEATKKIVNAAIIDKMKKGAVLINVGRADTVDAEAVAAALQSGKLAAYGTDVWPSDPPAEDYPILKAPNVLMTPHLGASTKENLLRIGVEVIDIIGNFVKGGTK